MKFHVIIPARYESSRLPGKPLAKIGHRAMIEHVCLRATESGAQSVTVATDHIDIKVCVEAAGFDAIMTDSNHVSGSDRIYQAAEILGLADDDIIVNVQGDEPFIPNQNISQVAGLISKHQTGMATLCCPIVDQQEANDPNAVKVIFDKNSRAIYFSRSTIPFVRGSSAGSDFCLGNHYRHIGIYAYSKSFLAEFISWPESSLEKLEKLEQLRVIENSRSIYLAVLKNTPPAGIDTLEDLVRANQYLQENN
jgi:3-deoxy-manno-octulosonate cytidylyltransferase (CMP-KDO synthetase)